MESNVIFFNLSKGKNGSIPLYIAFPDCKLGGCELTYISYSAVIAAIAHVHIDILQ